MSYVNGSSSNGLADREDGTGKFVGTVLTPFANHCACCVSLGAMMRSQKRFQIFSFHQLYAKVKWILFILDYPLLNQVAHLRGANP